MKKQSLLFVAGAMLVFASCQNEAPASGSTQEQIDSTVNARVNEEMMKLQASNDSAINSLAILKADSIVAAMKANGGTVVSKTTTTKTTTVKPSKPTKPTDEPKDNTPASTGKNTGEQGTATGKNGETQQQQGVPTGKRR